MQKKIDLVIAIEDLNIDYNSYITFRFEVPKDTANCGGCTLFGEDFGDHNQAIRIKAYYDEENEAETASQK